MSAADQKILVDAEEAAALFSMGKSTFWREVKNKNVPAPVKIGGLTRWRVSDLLRCRPAEKPDPLPVPIEYPKFVVRPKGCHLYRHFDEAGALLYVGISLSALNRLMAHMDDSAWYWSIAKVTIEVHPTREAAEAAERQAIRNERPLFNHMHGDRARRILALAML
jgi:predicted DNA-binding transcriptional regulator AlpA